MTDIVEIDPFGAVVHGQRHEIYQSLVRTGPIHRIMLPTGRPGWLVTGHAQARAVLNDSRLVKFVATPRSRLVGTARPDVERGFNSHMLARDGSEHARLRGLVGAVFTRRRIEALAPRIQQIADDLLDGLDQSGPTDLIAGFAYPLPMTVICELLGMPEQHRDDFRRAFVIAATGPPFVSDDDCIAACEALVSLARNLLVDRRARPGDDLVSDLIRVREGVDRLSEDELTSMVLLLVVAGHETTVNLLANGTLALLTHPDQLAKLSREPGLMSSAIEELLRFDPPLQTAFPFQATEPLEIGGVEISTGDVVLAVLLAANRDPDRVADPESLDISREPNPHLTFGHGVHHCLGAPLARLEGRIALTSLLKRYPRLRLAVPAEQLTYQPSLLFHALKSLPVTLT
jgi:cytochrome P450